MRVGREAARAAVAAVVVAVAVVAAAPLQHAPLTAATRNQPNCCPAGRSVEHPLSSAASS